MNGPMTRWQRLPPPTYRGSTRGQKFSLGCVDLTRELTLEDRVKGVLQIAER